MTAMILSASRRTDIPAFYAEWFMQRIKEGHALVPNPYNAHRLSRVALSPQLVDCIVFWTKNPGPMLPHLKKLEELGYKFVIQFSLTPYDSSIEYRVPPTEEMLQLFISLAKKLGSQRLVWRYDPVLINQNFTVRRHHDCFAKMCERLHPHAQRCIISFIDACKSSEKLFRPLSPQEQLALATGFTDIARSYGLGLFTCAEEVELERYGIRHGACIDKEHLEQLVGGPLNIRPDPHQRKACLCAEAVDLGVYDSCAHGCAYCYAVSNRQTAQRRLQLHDPCAPMLTGYPAGIEVISERTAKSHKSKQLSLL